MRTRPKAPLTGPVSSAAGHTARIGGPHRCPTDQLHQAARQRKSHGQPLVEHAEGTGINAHGASGRCWASTFVPGRRLPIRDERRSPVPLDQPFLRLARVFVGSPGDERGQPLQPVQLQRVGLPAMAAATIRHTRGPRAILDLRAHPHQSETASPDDRPILSPLHAEDDLRQGLLVWHLRAALASCWYVCPPLDRRADHNRRLRVTRRDAVAPVVRGCGLPLSDQTHRLRRQPAGDGYGTDRVLHPVRVCAGPLFAALRRGEALGYAMHRVAAAPPAQDQLHETLTAVEALIDTRIEQLIQELAQSHPSWSCKDISGHDGARHLWVVAACRDLTGADPHPRKDRLDRQRRRLAEIAEQRSASLDR
jgi:hypothetical protein